MNKLLIIWNQNKRKIIIVVIAIVLIIALIQILNNMAKNSKKEDSTNVVDNNLPIKSTITGAKMSVEETQSNTKLIDEFISECNNKNIDKAYEYLSDECKIEKFESDKSIFETNYIDVIFGEKRIYNISVEYCENNLYLYKVNFYNDALSTGNASTTMKYSDYITVDYNNNKINVGNFVFSKDINKKAEKNDITITAVKKAVYKDYEYYYIRVENHSDKDILLDSKEDNNTIRLVNSSGVIYNALSSELVDSVLKIGAGYSKTIKIKFMMQYNPNTSIKALRFTKIIPDYTEYKKDTVNYTDRLEISINL